MGTIAEVKPVGQSDEQTNSVELTEDGSIGREMAAAYRRMVDCYREHCKLPAEEAIKRADAMIPTQERRILDCEPDQVSWYDLHSLHSKDSKRSAERWEQINQFADDELRSGHRAAETMEMHGVVPGNGPNSWLSVLPSSTSGSQPAESSYH